MLSPMSKADIDEIFRIDPVIFPEESPMSINQLTGYFHADYSFVYKNDSNEVAAYLFARPSGTKSLFIGNIGVLSTLQGKGVGTKLLQAVMLKADKEQLNISLQVRSNNLSAIKLYTKCGFTVTTTGNEWTHMTRTPKPYEKQVSAEKVPSRLTNLCAVPVAEQPTLSKSPEAGPQPIEKDQMSPPQSRAESPKVSSAPLRKVATSKPTPLSANFLLQSIALLSLTAGLLALACLLLPPIGIIPLNAALGYTLAGLSSASALGVLSFWSANYPSKESETHSPKPTLI